MNSRKLRLESLEDRTLLAVTAGAVDSAASLTAPTEAATWAVNTLDDPAEWEANDDVLSLREAIARSAAGDTITFDAALTGGVITLNGTQIEITKPVTVDAADIGGITINADAKSRAISLAMEDPEAPVRLTGLTVTGGNADQGAAILNESGFLTLSGCVITGNRSMGLCGGVYNSGTLAMFECVVSDNTGPSGAGLSNTGSLTMAGCTVSNNTGAYGGGINSSGTLSMTDCTVSKNKSLSDSGGGISGSGSLTLTRCLVSENWAMSYGGGIDISSGTLTMVGCTVSGHRNSGGIYNTGGSLSLTDCLVCGNTSKVYGGGIFNYFGSVTLINCTVSGNSAETGGGIYNASQQALLEVFNSVIALNTASKTDPDLCNYYSFGTVRGYHSLSSFTGWGTAVSCSEYDPDLPLFAGAEAGDYRLAENSQAINAGNNDYVTTEVDLAGNARIVDVIVDLGAYEFPVSPSGDAETPSTVVTTELDVIDFTDGLISLREAILYAAPGETVTFDASLTGCTITLGGSELRIDKSLSIDADSVGGITVNANGGSRVFYFDGERDNLAVNLRALTITGGNAEAGGGIYSASAALALSACTVSGNGANGSGGGIYSTGAGSLELTSCIVSDNGANFGGGIYSYSAALSLVNCVVSANSADQRGGGIYLLYGSPVLTGCTVAGNLAKWNGGGIYCFGESLTAVNCIVALNHSDYNRDLIQVSGILSGNNNIIGFDPGFKSSPVFDSGTLTNRDSIDLSLSSTSWAIDRGDNSAAATETDLSGNTRIAAAWKSEETVDIGAYEYQIGFEKFPETPSVVVTTALDIVNDTDGLISLREAVLYASPKETITFASSLAGKVFALDGTPLLIDKSLSIDAGAVGGISIDAGGKSKVFRFDGENRDLSVNLAGLRIVNGKSENGGGIFCYSGTLTLIGCSVSGSKADSCGGGIYMKGSGNLTLIDSAVTDNASFDDGGAFYAFSTCALTFLRSTISGNTASNGGGIDSSGMLTMTDTLVSGNKARQNGGGIYGNDGTLTLTGCTVAGNSAARSGGGLYVRTASSLLCNTIVAQNSASGSGSDIFRYFGGLSPLCADAVLSSFTDWTESSGCLEYDSSAPLFADSENGVYSLAAGSQAINRGNSSCVTSETDLAGNPRIVNGIVDLGAYEYQGGETEQLTAPTITTGNKGIYVSYGANRHQIVWNAVEHASGYELAYSADGSFWTTAATGETSAVITGLTYGADMQYRVRALGDGVSYTDSDWSTVKVFNVCPMDINGDGDISGGDRVLMVGAWLSGEGDDEYRYYCDINGDGDVGGADRTFLSNNWLGSTEDDDLVYPPAKASDAVFAEFASADLDADLNAF